ncbi:ubiquitin protein ligase E3 component n-recognin 3 [Rhinolophus ferrumequinum]|uniref:Ubiquitin protein ligase E3 component n-recognin 3 n=1 Tax=Rhinolophus ferrumequinum TaxID=59479 RepID=A0A7J7YKM1_RHIFE|nr:ubiquitin protein ligase E3 component n-recognin 3 [Rhinolophus ferrumequinum]
MERKTGISGEASLSTFVKKDTKFLNNSGFLILLITSIKDGVHITMGCDAPPQHCIISSLSLRIYQQ